MLKSYGNLREKTLLLYNSNNTCIHLRWEGITAIQLNVIDLPLSKCLRICFHMVQNTRVTSTRVVSVVFVNAKF